MMTYWASEEGHVKHDKAMQDLIDFFVKLPCPDKQFTVMNGISHASFQQKNYKMVYQILHAYFTQPAPVYTDAGH